LPYIGFAPNWKNVLVGSGHSMMGISLAPATGKILAELHAQKSPSMELAGFKVDRF
jgi:D-amino-acid dehydrogenase